MVDETEFEIMDADDESRREDDLMLFHECPDCNSRCNCSDHPCSCCDTEDYSCQHQNGGWCNNPNHKECADSCDCGDKGVGCYRAL
jgi:hypothetical protein